MVRRAQHRRCGCRDGYALIEVMLGLMLIALLAAIALPGLVRGTGPAALRVSAFEISALLREDRTVAMRSGRVVTSFIEGNSVQSGATGSVVPMPAGVGILSPARIRFTPDGHASGGDIVVASDSARMIVGVSADTGAIRVVAP